MSLTLTTAALKRSMSNCVIWVSTRGSDGRPDPRGDAGSNAEDRVHRRSTPPTTSGTGCDGADAHPILARSRCRAGRWTATPRSGCGRLWFVSPLVDDEVQHPVALLRIADPEVVRREEQVRDRRPVHDELERAVELSQPVLEPRQLRGAQDGPPQRGQRRRARRVGQREVAGGARVSVSVRT